MVCLCPSVPQLLERGELETAKRYLTQYEAIESVWGEDGNIKEIHRIYYYIKGFLMLKENHLDSAEWMFRKTIGYSFDANIREAGCYGLIVKMRL